jgi:hypothetical protein
MQSILKSQFQVNFLHSFIYGARIYPELYHTYVKALIRPAGRS